MFPSLAVDMMEVGESTGALPTMLDSVAEFYEEDVANRTTAVLSLIEPAIMIFMGIFVAFVLVALYLPIFSLAGSIRSNSLWRQKLSKLTIPRRNRRMRAAWRAGTGVSTSI